MNTHPLKRSIIVVAFATLLPIGCSVNVSPDKRTELDDEMRTPPQQTNAPESEMVLRQSGRAATVATVDGPAPAAKRKSEKRLGSLVGVVTSEEAMRTRDLSSMRYPRESIDRETYKHFDDNPVKRVAEYPVSTFSIDVDTGAYANVRRFLQAGRLPPGDAVRVEELINYFSYAYPPPKDQSRPFHVTTEIAPAPWNTKRHLLHIGIKGYDVPKTDLPPANLVFLVDVSGSMRAPNKLELLKTSLKLLSRQLRSEDRISIVVYAGASGVVLEPVAGNATAKIMAALDTLTAGGSTNGGAGIRLAYAMAEQATIRNGINRIILATDGDFNVGTVNFEALKDLIEQKREAGISLTTLGFGTGNYNDQLMEQLADAGNGNYGYIDNLKEAQKVLVDEISSTMHTIAKDVKIQIEFNPDVVAEYRLIGYENRVLRREDFNNDKVDAGEIGAGHTVTALYEIVLQGSDALYMEPSRYSPQTEVTHEHGDELAFVRMRYKLPGGKKSALTEWPLTKQDMTATIAATSDNFRFSTAVAAFGQLLRGGIYTGDMGYADITELARNARGHDSFGYRGEFIQLVNLAQSLAMTNKQARR